MSVSKTAVVLPAGGLGKRVGGDRPKQLMDVGGKPLYRYALESFLRHPQIAEVVLCYPREWKDWFIDDLRDLPVHLVEGGAERWLSVRNGVESLASDITHVLVHDIARPFLSDELIDQCVQAVAAGPFLVAKACADTVKVAKNSMVEKTLDRNQIWLAQTPQGSSLALLRELYEQADGETEFLPTDEASIWEHYGHEVSIVEGNSLNDKITTADDLEKWRAWVNYKISKEKGEVE
jgi:2-C-methyl-D-erythritol 4-phosphate cytidylyltransferase